MFELLWKKDAYARTPRYASATDAYPIAAAAGVRITHERCRIRTDADIGFGDDTLITSGAV